MEELAIIKELLAIGLAGEFYSKDKFDTERYQRIGALGRELLANRTPHPPQQIALQFEGEYGYQTPKVDTRAVVWQGDKILLVQESNGQWALPGGWMDVNETISSNALKELAEEAGIEATAKRLIMIQDRNLHNPGQSIFTILKCFVECELQAMAFQPNSETLAAEFFDPAELPELFGEKTSAEQIALCQQAKAQGSQWQVLYD